MKTIILITSLFFASISFAKSSIQVNEDNREIYTMISGDTISEVLFNKGYKKLYKKNGPVEQALELNNLTNESARRIAVGTKIILPYYSNGNQKVIAPQKEQMAESPEFEEEAEQDADEAVVSEEDDEEESTEEVVNSPEPKIDPETQKEFKNKDIILENEEVAEEESQEDEDDEEELGSVFEESTVEKRETASEEVEEKEIEFNTTKEGDLEFKEPDFDPSEFEEE